MFDFQTFSCSRSQFLKCPLIPAEQGGREGAEFPVPVGEKVTVALSRPEARQMTGRYQTVSKTLPGAAGVWRAPGRLTKRGSRESAAF